MDPIVTVIWICVVVFASTAAITLLALTGILALGRTPDAHDWYLKKLFQALVIQIVIIAVGAFADHFRRGGPEPTPKSIQVLSDRHTDRSVGRYFHFDAGQLDNVLGYTSWGTGKDGTALYISRERGGLYRAAIVWHKPNGGDHGNAHGRYKDNPQPGDWKVGDWIYIRAQRDDLK